MRHRRGKVVAVGSSTAADADVREILRLAFEGGFTTADRLTSRNVVVLLFTRTNDNRQTQAHDGTLGRRWARPLAPTTPSLSSRLLGLSGRAAAAWLSNGDSTIDATHTKYQQRFGGAHRR